MARLSVYVMVAIVGGVGVSRPARAQNARYPREQPATEAPVLSERVTPLVAKAAAEVPAATKPSISADDVLSIDGLRGQIRNEQEPILVELIANTPDSEVEEKADYYFRLGELYAKEMKFWREKGDATRTKDFLLKTVKVYKALTGNDAFRNYPKMDLALFYYAYTLQSGRYMKESRAVYDSLLKTHPESKYVPEAYLAFADYYADNAQLADAEASYKKVLEFPKSTVYPYALYRMGWLDLQQGHAQEAAEKFSKVVRATRTDRAQESLYRAAKADFAGAYVAMDKHSLGNMKVDDSIDVLDLTAEAAWTEGSPERVLAAYRALTSRMPGDARACLWQYRIARATLSMPGASTGDKVKEVGALVRLMTAKSDSECRENAAAMSGELGAAYFAEWSKTKNVASLTAAEQLSSLHVATVPDDEEARAQYGEVLWAQADHESNAKLRRQVWEHAAEVFSSVSTPEAARAAALARMNALDIVLPSDAKVAIGPAPRHAPRALNISTADAKMLAAIAAYEPQGPSDDDEELAEMRFAAAITLRRYRHFDEAVTVLDRFLEHHHDNARAELVANLLLDSMVQRGRPDETLDVVEAIAADQGFVEGKPELARNIQLLRSRSLHAVK